MGPLSIIKAMLAKDLRRELRSREIFIATFFFSIILLTVIYIATTTGGINHRRFGSGALWLCLLFSGTISLNRTHQAEMENGCYRALILYPAEGGWLFLAKSITNLVLLFTTLLLVMPLMTIFFDLPATTQWPEMLLSLFLGLGAFVAVGTLVVVVSANTRMKDVLFPIIQLPLVVPVLIAGVNSTQLAMDGTASWNWLKFLISLNVVFYAVGFLVYEYLLEE